MRDEYDKLEGALRKLGVDPDTIVGNHGLSSGVSSGPDAEDYLEDELSEVGLDPDLCTPFNVVAVPASSSNHLEDDESLQARTVGRLRHLDIVEEVKSSTGFGV